VSQPTESFRNKVLRAINGYEKREATGLRWQQTGRPQRRVRTEALSQQAVSVWVARDVTPCANPSMAARIAVSVLASPRRGAPQASLLPMPVPGGAGVGTHSSWTLLRASLVVEDYCFGRLSDPVVVIQVRPMSLRFSPSSPCASLLLLSHAWSPQ
jgi:hypothetical protein